jgi:hypothetical protein
VPLDSNWWFVFNSKECHKSHYIAGHQANLKIILGNKLSNQMDHLWIVEEDRLWKKSVDKKYDSFSIESFSHSNTIIKRKAN